MYDLIGDIHGYATPLRKLLTKLGYAERDGVWRHPDRQVIFLGDFIDRGPEQLKTVAIARGMVEAGAALAVMGNHEFNAIAWATEAPQAKSEAPQTEPAGALPAVAQAPAFLRPHTDENRKQHRAFLDQVVEGSALHRECINWFKTLPLYLDLNGIRVVHACWHLGSIEQLALHLDQYQRLRPEAWVAANTKGHPAYENIEVLLKGWEVKLPAGHTFPDQYGKHRSEIRARWWRQGESTYRDLALVPRGRESLIPEMTCPTEKLPGYDQQKPLFLGHYWLSEDPPEPLTDQIACLDYSIASEDAGSEVVGKLCAYRWDGEGGLRPEKFVWVSG